MKEDHRWHHHRVGHLHCNNDNGFDFIMNLSLVIEFMLCVGMVTAAPEGVKPSQNQDLNGQIFNAAFTETTTITSNIPYAIFMNVTGVCCSRRGFSDVISFSSFEF